jgi:hypothetical protein
MAPWHSIGALGEGLAGWTIYYRKPREQSFVFAIFNARYHRVNYLFRYIEIVLTN